MMQSRQNWQGNDGCGYSKFKIGASQRKNSPVPPKSPSARIPPVRQRSLSRSLARSLPAAKSAWFPRLIEPCPHSSTMARHLSFEVKCSRGFPIRSCDGSPTLPSQWEQIKMRYWYKGTLYNILIENPKHLQRGEVSLELDGQILPSKEILLADDGTVHTICVKIN